MKEDFQITFINHRFVILITEHTHFHELSNALFSFTPNVSSRVQAFQREARVRTFPRDARDDKRPGYPPLLQTMGNTTYDRKTQDVSNDKASGHSSEDTMATKEEVVERQVGDVEEAACVSFNFSGWSPGVHGIYPKPRDNVMRICGSRDHCFYAEESTHTDGLNHRVENTTEATVYGLGAALLRRTYRSGISRRGSLSVIV
jgi:hypothetical protein